MSTKNNQNLRKELDYNFLDEEWSDDEQGLISVQELQTPAAPAPVTTQEQPTEIKLFTMFCKPNPIPTPRALAKIKIFL